VPTKFIQWHRGAAAAGGFIPSRATALYSFHRQPRRESKTEACFTAQQICQLTWLKKNQNRHWPATKLIYIFAFQSKDSTAE